MSDINAKLLKELRIDGNQRPTESAAPRWLWPALGSLLALAAIGSAGIWYFSGRPLVVTTATASAPGTGGPAGAILQATGYITARRQATVSTQITGTLTQVLIEEGDRVEKGQVIARLEDSGLRASLDVANANLMTSQAQVTAAQAQLAQAEADSRRQESLVASGMATRQFAEQSRTAVSTAAAQLDARRREADSARAQVAQAKVNFDYAIVRAPFAGVVTVKAAQVGEIVSPLSAGGGFTRTGVGTIVDMESLEIDVDVSEAYIGQVKPQMPAEATLSAYPDWKIPAHVIAIIPSADRGKATVKVRVGLEQKDPRIVPDMGVRVSFLGPKAPLAAQAPKGVLVPAQAIAQRGGKSVVFVVEGNKAVQRAVGPTVDFATMKLVADGLKVGERVVLSPPPALQDGASVATPEPP
ncbi:MAG: efflux RND transporter periplasmic adaptor subunit [Pseudomonadota bacterium]|nr:efflux RND transporter periplasmic adaptor subunit [Pseudomonadota bacterium]